MTFIYVILEDPVKKVGQNIAKYYQESDILIKTSWSNKIDKEKITKCDLLKLVDLEWSKNSMFLSTVMNKK